MHGSCKKGPMSQGHAHFPHSWLVAPIAQPLLRGGISLIQGGTDTHALTTGWDGPPEKTYIATNSLYVWHGT